MFMVVWSLPLLAGLGGGGDGKSAPSRSCPVDGWGFMLSWCPSAAPGGLSSVGSSLIHVGLSARVFWRQGPSIRRLGAGLKRQDLQPLCPPWPAWRRGRRVPRWSVLRALNPGRSWRRRGLSLRAALFLLSDTGAVPAVAGFPSNPPASMVVAWSSVFRSWRRPSPRNSSPVINGGSSVMALDQTAVGLPLLRSVRRNPSAPRLQVVRPRSRRCSPVMELCSGGGRWLGLDCFPCFPRGPLCLFQDPWVIFTF
jgi:hypothetical protein